MSWGDFLADCFLGVTERAIRAVDWMLGAGPDESDPKFCGRCKVKREFKGDRFDAELALVKLDYVCPRCGVEATESH